MTQSIVVQVGQCGNQIGHRFWDLALREHASVNKKGLYDSALSTFFLNGDDGGCGAMRQKVKGLKARAVMIDMEEGVVGEILKGDLARLFDHQQLITDVSGSGNNWATGHCYYGSKYREQISETVRKAAELCDCLQCFFVLHSMGGGTGSGVGTYVTRLLADEYPEVHRLVTAVYPSPDDDVITSPYNSVLAMRHLTESADCVIPVENFRLAEIVGKVQSTVSAAPSLAGKKGSVISGDGGVDKTERPFDAMNNVVANLLLNLTCSSRFEGTLNVDLNEISMNLVPFPRMHYLVAAQSPLYTRPEVVLPSRRVDQMFSDSFTRDFQLLSVDPRRHVYLACALLVRGAVDVSDVRRNIDRMQSRLNFAHWNLDGWKVGHCNVPPSGQRYALLNLSNNTCVHTTMAELLQRFNKLYRRKAHIYHYTQVDGFEEADFADSLESLVSLKEDYAGVETKNDSGVCLERLKISG